ncbi:phosphoserine phosphatase SerB [Acidicapsa acidisoli]|uniref:phosphoserine phosphatase SerB n=1 Tax=Acidicapsa acidisoli TaxID=1615681 RepID=UPI0021E089EC|nr:phosphoserine phosphatase SerB [Acidicapsa acidisoli]
MKETMQEFENDWVITVIGRTDVEHALGPVVDVVKEQGLELDRIEALSSVMPGGRIETVEGEPGYACAEIWACGTVANDAGMRAELMALADQLAVDIAFQRVSEYRQERRLFVFDMDSTLIQGETIDELAKMAGVGDQVVAITASAMRGEIQFQESFRRRVGLLKGLPEARVLEVVDRIPLMEGAERLFRALRARGAKTAILSGGFTFFGAVLQEKLGVDFVHANELDVRDGIVTGEVRGRIVDGAYKAELLVEIARREGIPLEQVVAVGDGANDLPMLGLAGMGVAFHAKPVVRASARFSMTHVGLDGLLYLLGVPDRGWA